MNQSTHLSVLGVTLATTLAISLGGCAQLEKASDFLKDVENKAYDSAAKGASRYCKRVAVQTKNASEQAYKFALRERVEARREIRQRGKNGPLGLGDGHEGPIVIIWCEGDDVPRGILDYLEKDV